MKLRLSCNLVLTFLFCAAVCDVFRWEVAGKTLLAGGVAGAVSRTVVAPFERLKIIFQTQGQPPMYTGVVQALQKIGREEGVKGYFKGNGVNCIRIFPTSALQFYCYETYKRVRMAHALIGASRAPIEILNGPAIVPPPSRIPLLLTLQY